MVGSEYSIPHRYNDGLHLQERGDAANTEVGVDALSKLARQRAGGTIRANVAEAIDDGEHPGGSLARGEVGVDPTDKEFGSGRAARGQSFKQALGGGTQEIRSWQVTRYWTSTIAWSQPEQRESQTTAASSARPMVCRPGTGPDARTAHSGSGPTTAQAARRSRESRGTVQLPSEYT